MLKNFRKLLKNNKMTSYIGVKTVVEQSTDIKKARIILNNGQPFPVFGFGTYLIKDKNRLLAALDVALETGYRSIDTATSYGNEQMIGDALKHLLPKHNLKREDIFLTTKIAPKEQGTQHSRKAVADSLQRLQVDYIDLVLIHWPGAGHIDVKSPENKTLRHESWVELENYVDQGKIKSIGVSNYTLKHLKDLFTYCRIPPVLNQVEYHVHFRHPTEFESFCGSKNIILQSYCTLGGGSNKDVLEDGTVGEIAKQLNVSPAQVLLRWALQKGWAVIPKSVTKERIIENGNLNFVIKPNQMEILDGIKARRKYSWNPDMVA